MGEQQSGWGGRPVYVVDGSRTPYLKARGKPGPFSASDLALAAGRPLLARQPFAADELDEVILGCMMPSPDEANIARVVALRLGCGEQVPAWTVLSIISRLISKRCASISAVCPMDKPTTGSVSPRSRAITGLKCPGRNWLSTFSFAPAVLARASAANQFTIASL